MQADAFSPGDLNWLIDTRALPTRGLSGEFRASPEQREAVAAFLSITALDEFVLSYTALRRADGLYRFHGTLTASAVQDCVVTQEPVREKLHEQFDVRFSAEADPTPTEFDAADIDFDPPELLTNGRIDAGTFAVELLSVSLDPYPRVEGAQFDSDEAAKLGAPPEPEPGPFAALEKLRKTT